MKNLIGAIDAGGTTFKCGVMTPERKILAYKRIETTAPEATFQACLDFFNAEEKISALGIACFGPLNLDKDAPEFGMIHSTPKPGWSEAHPRKWFNEALSVPVQIETDVNAALLAERAWGAAQNASSAVYITVGTGIGAGLYANGGLLGKPHHAEFGHIPVERFAVDKEFVGMCPFHGNCLEGMASAPTLWKRFGDPEKLPPDHLGWQIITDYMAQACQSLILTLRPEKILLGGGLMQAPHIVGQIKGRLAERLGGYAGITLEEIETIITPPLLGDDAGLLGAAYLALR